MILKEWDFTDTEGRESETKMISWWNGDDVVAINRWIYDHFCEHEFIFTFAKKKNIFFFNFEYSFLFFLQFYLALSNKRKNCQMKIVCKKCILPSNKSTWTLQVNLSEKWKNKNRYERDKTVKTWWVNCCLKSEFSFDWFGVCLVFVCCCFWLWQQYSTNLYW